jgi:hypothetical protein
MSKPTYELADIIKEYRTSFIQKYSPLKQHQRVLNAIEHCRTAYLGYHLDRCDSCNHERISYNSCRNRHCPKCQGTNRERWIMARKNDLLSCTYFHVVFTLPSELNPYCLRFPKEMYTILFAASKETIMQFGYDPKHLGAQMGIISVLHTWGQNLSLHPHVHMIIPGGGITQAGNWKHAKSDGEYLFCVKALSEVYKGKLMEKLKFFLQTINQPMSIRFKERLYNKKWVVYSKKPFGGPDQVIEYLGRYSHKIAISNHRIKNIANGNIVFSYKDYAHGSVQKLMTLKAEDFLQRFCMHILPPKFMKIRHYGILASRTKPKLKMQQMKMGILIVKKEKENQLAKGWKEITKIRMGFDVDACPCCKKGRMIRVMSFDANAPPPKKYGEQGQTINHKLKLKKQQN